MSPPGTPAVWQAGWAPCSFPCHRQFQVDHFDGRNVSNQHRFSTDTGNHHQSAWLSTRYIPACQRFQLRLPTSYHLPPRHTRNLCSFKYSTQSAKTGRQDPLAHRKKAQRSYTVINLGADPLESGRGEAKRGKAPHSSSKVHRETSLPRHSRRRRRTTRSIE